MSQTKQLAANLGNTVRRATASGSTAGSGGNQRLYVGRDGSFDYDAYLRFAMNWTDVGRIVSAVMSLYTDDGLGQFDSTTTEHPTIILKRLKSAFSEGSGSTGFPAGDYTAPGYLSTGQHSQAMTRAVFGLNSIDVTAFVEEWAPKGVKRRNGNPGGAATNYGIGLYGLTDAHKNWAGFSEDYTNAVYRPVITLTYEYATTVPTTPTSLTPTGAIDTLTTFDGTFADVDTTDFMAFSEVQVYTASAVKSGDADLDNTIDVSAHGYSVGQAVWFHSLTGGAGLSVARVYYVKAVVNANSFTVALTPGGAVVDVSTAYSALTVAAALYDVKKPVTATEADNAVFTHEAVGLPLLTSTTYKWRARTWDQEGQASAWTALVSFSVNNIEPDAPTLSPVNAASFATLDGVLFRGGTFSDPDVGDTLLAYQVQLSFYPEGDARWDDSEYIAWDTGKRYAALGATDWSAPYGGGPLIGGTYYWRARQWDNHQAVSDWEYASIVVTDDYSPDPDNLQTAIQLRPRAPWRIVIKAMGALRGPGAIVAVLEDAKNVGASILFNSPGELHFTLSKDHPQIAGIEPKRSHYSVQFRQGDGWREVFAGLMWDFDASDTDVVFYGIDYLAILDYLVDERYDASRPNLPAEKGGSKYITTGKNAIWYIVQDQLYRAATLANSPVGFITGATNPKLGRSANIALMTETLTVFSTYAPTLSFITGLLDSHRAGTGKKTRLSVRQKTGGGYEFVVQDDPGQVRENLRMRYGELVQGYRVIPFGSNWGSRISAIGREKDGIAVLYKTATAPGIDEAVFGHFAQVRLIDGVSDPRDMQRRTNQAAVAAGKLGKSVALGFRSGLLLPRDGYDVCDQFHIDIVDGSVDTDAFGSGYWVAAGVTWTTEAQNGKMQTTLTFTPREDSESPDSDLLTLEPISPQREWMMRSGPPPGRPFVAVIPVGGTIAGTDGNRYTVEGGSVIKWYYDITSQSHALYAQWTDNGSIPVGIDGYMEGGNSGSYVASVDDPVTWPASGVGPEIQVGIALDGTHILGYSLSDPWGPTGFGPGGATKAVVRPILVSGTGTGF